MVFEISNKRREDYVVAVMLGLDRTRGDVGIEIEVEGEKLPHFSKVPDPWAFHNDGSLRGKENAEYVLKKPVLFDDVKPSLDKLWSVFAEYGSVFDDSNRTSVHVHLNCQTFHLNRLASFAALFFALEEVLVEWCGEHRVGNLFCLRAKDAPAVVSQLRRFIQRGGGEMRDHLHYANLNTNALHKFGSVEVRSLRGCADPGVILDWVMILRRIYELSAEFTDPRAIPAEFSREGPSGFFDLILGDQAAVVRRGLGEEWTEERIRDSMYEGIRLAQDVCYARDWDRFNPIPMKEDPFDRRMKKPFPSPTPAPVYLSESTNLGSFQEFMTSMAPPAQAVMQTLMPTNAIYVSNPFTPEYDLEQF